MVEGDGSVTCIDDPYTGIVTNRAWLNNASAAPVMVTVHWKFTSTEKFREMRTILTESSSQVEVPANAVNFAAGAEYQRPPGDEGPGGVLCEREIESPPA